MAFGFPSFGLGGGSSQSSQQSESGLPQAQRINAYNMAFPLAKDISDRARSLFDSDVPTVPLLPSGFMPQQLEGVKTLFRDAISKYSAMGGARGRLSPENTGAVFGSALQNISPLLLQMISENVLKSIFMPEQIKQSRLSGFQNTVNPFLTLATSGASGLGTSAGFNFSGNVGDEAGGGGGKKTP